MFDFTWSIYRVQAWSPALIKDTDSRAGIAKSDKADQGFKEQELCKEDNEDKIYYWERKRRFCYFYNLFLTTTDYGVTCMQRFKIYRVGQIKYIYQCIGE